MDYTIRSMREEDIAQVQHVANMTWHATYDGIIPYSVQETFLQRAYHDTRLKLRLERSHLFVAETPDGIVGFANFSPVRNDGKAELGAIYLYPSYQGYGIGSALLQKGIDALDKVTEIYVNVEKSNQPGMMFYASKGFETVKEMEECFDGHTLKTVRLVWRLGAAE